MPLALTSGAPLAYPQHVAANAQLDKGSSAEPSESEMRQTRSAYYSPMPSTIIKWLAAALLSSSNRRNAPNRPVCASNDSRFAPNRTDSNTHISHTFAQLR